MKISINILFLFTLIIYGCGGGIEPAPVQSEDQRPGFSGKISFVGNWPDSITRTHIVVFKNAINSAGDFNAFNIAYVSLEIPYGVTEFNYSSLDSSYLEIVPGEFKYVAVAQSKTPQLLLDRKAWTVAGLYYSNSDTTKPGILVINQTGVTTGINIICDFNNPPPQPPGGE